MVHENLATLPAAPHRRPRPPGVKLRAWQLMADRQTPAAISRRLGVSRWTVYRWRDEARRAMEAGA